MNRTVPTMSSISISAAANEIYAYGIVFSPRLARCGFVALA